MTNRPSPPPPPPGTQPQEALISDICPPVGKCPGLTWRISLIESFPPLLPVLHTLLTPHVSLSLSFPFPALLFYRNCAVGKAALETGKVEIGMLFLLRVALLIMYLNICLAINDREDHYDTQSIKSSL